jgi:DNA-binding NarL/FixJ family response regulator
MSIRVAIVEDDEIVRENLALLINAAAGFSCVAACASGEEALQRLGQVSPEVILMDIHLPGQNGITCVGRLRALLPQVQIIMLTIEADGERVFESLKAGATGYLVKHVSIAEILEAVAEVHRGGAPMSSQIARKVVTTFRQSTDPEKPAVQLSPREEEVLRFLATGLRSKEIAKILDLSVGTVNTHVRHIYDKLHVRSRAHAVARFPISERHN